MLAAPLLDALLDRALQEDLAGGDLTTESCVDAGAQATGNAVSAEWPVPCGPRQRGQRTSAWAEAMSENATSRSEISKRRA